jgi:class 3 adenylate cyclase
MSSPPILSPPPSDQPSTRRRRGADASPHRPAVAEIPAKALQWLRAAGHGSRNVLGGLHVGHRSLDSVLFGCLLTLLAVAADSAGWLSPLEYLLYDARAKLFQFFLPAPTDKLVHLDIDEGVIEAIQATDKNRFPWPRSTWAELMDEVALAKPRVVGLDVLFSEAEKPTWVPISTAPGSTTRATSGPAAGADVYTGPSRLVHHDEVLGASLTRLGCALVPVSLPFRRQHVPSPLQAAVRAVLAEDVNLPPAAVVGRLRARGFDEAGAAVAPAGERDGGTATTRGGGGGGGDIVAIRDLSDRVAAEYLAAWKFHMSAAIRRELRADATAGLARVKRTLMRTGRSDLLLDATFDDLYREAISAWHMARFSRPIPPGTPALFDTTLENVPVPPLATAAAHSGYVDHPPFPDGRVRALPLFVKHGDRMFPQMGLAMACAQLGVDVGALRLGTDSVVVPLPDGREVVVPYRSIRSAELGQSIATFMDLPWWGGADWTTMYDHPNHARPAAHMSAVALWDLVLTRRKLAVNAGAADAALVAVLASADQSEAAAAYAARPPPPEDVEARRTLYARHVAKAAERAEFLRSFDAAELDEADRRVLGALDTLPALLRESDAVARRLRDDRAALRRAIEGKAVFVGWTFTGAAADFVPTSVHPKCPGVVLHGAVFNAIMTGELWRTLPDWATYVVTALLGLSMTAAAAFMTPARALVVASALGVGYALVNGLLLFDYGNLVLGAAGPLLCVAGVWQGCTLVRLIAERYQRSRIEGRFRSYVDPALVDYVVRNPDQIKLEGQVREMTVCFTDLGNFTPLTARLQEATVPLLNRLFGAMVPEIRRHHGYVNKFLGDGIMFFFGAPRENPQHARDAVRTILDIQHVLRAVNAELVAEGLPEITLRVGVNTGRMVVGDAGSEEASDYTVLGDSVNLASRLESANKQLGTWNLVSARTVELSGPDEDWLLRPVGRICVVGRDEPVLAFEVLGRRAEATDEQRRLAEGSAEMVDAYQAARFADCLRAADALDAEFGPSKLSERYRERCEHFLANGGDGDAGGGADRAFDSMLTLMEK